MAQTVRERLFFSQMNELALNLLIRYETSRLIWISEKMRRTSCVVVVFIVFKWKTKSNWKAAFFANDEFRWGQLRANVWSQNSVVWSESLWEYGFFLWEVITHNFCTVSHLFSRLHQTLHCCAEASQNRLIVQSRRSDLVRWIRHFWSSASSLSTVPVHRIQLPSPLKREQQSFKN